MAVIEITYQSILVHIFIVLAMRMFCLYLIFSQLSHDFINRYEFNPTADYEVLVYYLHTAKYQSIRCRDNEFDPYLLVTPIGHMRIARNVILRFNVLSHAKRYCRNTISVSSFVTFLSLRRNVVCTVSFGIQSVVQAEEVIAGSVQLCRNTASRWRISPEGDYDGQA
jgi:hypothetical protein